MILNIDIDAAYKVINVIKIIKIILYSLQLNINIK